MSPSHTDSGAVSFYTAPNAVPPGNTVNITATAAADPTQHVTTTITLTTTTQQVGLTFTQLPPGNLEVNSIAMITAMVTNDPTNAGVDWLLTCGGGSFCGSLSQTHTASGSANAYTAPSMVPNGGGIVNIMAIATAAPMVTLTTSVQIVNNSLGITFTQAPPATLIEGTQASIIATVTNDSSSAGVDWTVTCGSSDCGSFNPVHTDSGAATVYTAPATIPTGNNVTIVASSTASPSTNTSAVVQITSPTNLNNLLSGPYAISLAGTDTNGFYGASGSFVADGNGNITAGEQDFVDPNVLVGPFSFIGTYNIGPDGRGAMQLFNNASVGIQCQPGSCPPGYFSEQVISFAVVNSSHSQVIQFDYSATSSGSFDLQTTSDFTLAGVTGGYSFAFPGVDISQFPTFLPASVGGVFTADGNGNFTSGTEDINSNGIVSSSPITGAYATAGPPDTFGRVTAEFDSGYTFTFYIVNSGQLDFIETDLTFTMSGAAFTQGAGSFGNGSFSGPFGFTAAGVNGTKQRAVGGLLTSNGSGSVSGGLIDVNDAGTITSGSFTGTYSISSNARGTMTLTGTTGGVSKFAFYITKSQGIELLEIDSGSLSSGAALAGSSTVSGSTFKGNYATFYDANPSNGRIDAVGQLVADGSSMLSGTADLNQFLASPVETSQVAYTGSFTSETNGRFTGTLQSSPTGILQEVFYVLNNSTVLLLEVDSTPARGMFQLQKLQ